MIMMIIMIIQTMIIMIIQTIMLTIVIMNIVDNTNLLSQGSDRLRRAAARDPPEGISFSNENN